MNFLHDGVITTDDCPIPKLTADDGTIPITLKMPPVLLKSVLTL